ncbi:MAG: hypothetical protein QG656_842 [Candidatus Hydrogenedentes bacterium]|nr:hypothetical protein [Candidatus Hydrogenedentota bacterium]
MTSTIREQLDTAPCYCCGGRDGAVWGEENGFTMIKCADCGLVYLNPRPSEDAIDEAARTGLHRAGAGVLNAIGSYSRRKVDEYRTKLTQLLGPGALARQPVRWLDIGAGYGELVEAVQQLAGENAEVLGIEPCEPKVKKARARGRPIEPRALKDAGTGLTHISLINVYSHLPDPAAFLAELRPRLAPGGYLLLVTGNAADVTRDEFPGALYLPDHLSFAGEVTLKRVLNKAGFDIVKMDSHAALPTSDGLVTTFVKNIARRLYGRAALPSSFPPNSRFRSLWILARVRVPNQE